MKKGKPQKAFNFTQFDFRSKYSGVLEGRGRGGMADQLTLFQPGRGGADFAHYIDTAPTPFLNFRHLWYSISFGQFEGQIEFPIIKVKCVTAFGANSRTLRKSIIEILATVEL